MAIGALQVVAGVAGGYFYPGLVNRVETTRGTISEARFLAEDGGAQALSRQRRTAMLSVDYLADGKPRHLEESVSTSAGAGERTYGVGNPITVYIRRGKDDSYATLAEPKPLILVWIGIGVFGLVWIVLGWLMGRR